MEWLLSLLPIQRFCLFHDVHSEMEGLLNKAGIEIASSQGHTKVRGGSNSSFIISPIKPPLGRN